jgi:hypothetical protein
MKGALGIMSGDIFILKMAPPRAGVWPSILKTEVLL